MLSLRSFIALRLFSGVNVHRTVQCCGFKSRYNIENLHPNTGSDLSVKVNSVYRISYREAFASSSCAVYHLMQK